MAPLSYHNNVNRSGEQKPSHEWHFKRRRKCGGCWETDQTRYMYGKKILLSFFQLLSLTTKNFDLSNRNRISKNINDFLQIFKYFVFSHCKCGNAFVNETNVNALQCNRMNTSNFTINLMSIESIRATYLIRGR